MTTAFLGVIFVDREGPSTAIDRIPGAAERTALLERAIVDAPRISGACQEADTTRRARTAGSASASVRALLVCATAARTVFASGDHHIPIKLPSFNVQGGARHRVGSDRVGSAE